MVTPDLQPSLFRTSKEEALILANASETMANHWFNKNYLSFDISKVNDLQQYEVLELTFISKLFESQLDTEIINKLLLKLPKPYAYDYKNVFFNVYSNSWEYLPKEIDEEEIIESYINNLNTEDDREKIEDIIKRLKRRIEKFQ